MSIVQMPAHFRQSGPNYCCENNAWTADVIAGSHRIRLEKDIDEAAVAIPKFYTIGVLLIPLSPTTSLSHTQAFKSTYKPKDLVDIEMGVSQRTTKHTTNNEAFNRIDHGRTKPGLYPFLNFSMNPFRIVSNSSTSNTTTNRVVSFPDEVSQPTLSATSLSLASSSSDARRVVKDSHNQPRQIEAAADETASDRSTIGLLPHNPQRPSKGDMQASDNDVEEICLAEDLTASTTMCSSLYSLRLPLYKLLSSESVLPTTSSSPSSVTAAQLSGQLQKGEQKSSSAGLEQKSKPALMELKVNPTELMVIDVTGQIYVSKEIFGLGSAESQTSTEPAAEATSSLSAAAAADVETPADDLKEDSLVGNEQSNNNSLSSVSSLGSANPAAVRDSSMMSSGAGGEKSTYTRLKSSTRDDGDGDIKYHLDAVREASSASHDDTEGLPAVTAAVAAASTTAEAVTSEGVLACTGGKFVKEECVVCFTDHKEVMLLPCRHMSVCSSCLVFIDKCPVCRAFFEEYIVVQSKKLHSLSVPQRV
eukprot:CAMPEP_0170070472 /NCGR_PEP_ID=MMETSP0019_2-20121128/8750_1 /TAXON_ID=98059 /ORGANISM="Dinobryon sp., Strain UTEXLB2267" /LENGTH=531 /DNA_ID=CAMNT_0010278757 /DNA_START=595 /DNA_END=2190 /DNA_ORIENTATION=-